MTNAVAACSARTATVLRGFINFLRRCATRSETTTKSLAAAARGPTTHPRRLNSGRRREPVLDGRKLRPLTAYAAAGGRTSSGA
jgi:hypothetical protein